MEWGHRRVRALLRFGLPWLPDAISKSAFRPFNPSLALISLSSPLKMGVGWLMVAVCL
ncbi:MAG: hypothetical protein WCD18_12535 [Thermosynechococcaceae cyanobacterium]